MPPLPNSFHSMHFKLSVAGENDFPTLRKQTSVENEIQFVVGLPNKMREIIF